MNTIEFKYLIKNAQYRTKYEPIIDTKNDTIYGYEALSKFEINQEIISTEEIFRKLHHNNKFFFELEKRNKLLQVKNFDINNKKLFLNFDADIVYSDEQTDYWDGFLRTINDNIVIEITENGSDDEKSSKVMQNFSTWLMNRGIDSALDDFGKDGSMFSFFLMNQSKYIKIDKSFLNEIKNNNNYIYYLEGLIKTIKKDGKKSIIEGIETKNDYYFAKELEFDYMQGYYFKDKNIVR